MSLLPIRLSANLLAPSAVALFVTAICAGCGGGSASSTSNSTYNNLNPAVLPPGVTVSSQAAIARNAQAEPGWQTCIGACANAAVPQIYTMTQNVASPSLNNDSTATAYSESGTAYGDVLWHYGFGSSPATHFVIDLYLMIDQPENVQALEFAVLKNDGLNWYKTSTQCNYQSGELRGFDVQTFQWQDLNATCVPARANTWQRVTLQYSITGGTTNFEGVSFDGVVQPIAVSLPPEPQTAASELLGIHIQLDNANTTAGYTVYVDDWSVYSW
jgi:hypothetical protein